MEEGLILESAFTINLQMIISHHIKITITMNDLMYIDLHFNFSDST